MRRLYLSAHGESRLANRPMSRPWISDAVLDDLDDVLALNLLSETEQPKIDCEGCEQYILIETHRNSKLKCIYKFPYQRSIFNELRVTLALRTRLRLRRVFR